MEISIYFSHVQVVAVCSGKASVIRMDIRHQRLASFLDLGRFDGYGEFGHYGKFEKYE